MADTKPPKDTPQEPTIIGGEDAAELIAKLDQGYPPAWIPENAGDTIVGAFLRLETGVTAFGRAQVAVVGTTDGERSVFLFYETLKTGFRRTQPEPGERIAIRYEGLKPAKNPTPGRQATYHDFTVTVDRAAARAVDWNAALGEDTPREAEPEPSSIGASE
jgi:hypothetical protein